MVLRCRFEAGGDVAEDGSSDVKFEAGDGAVDVEVEFASGCDMVAVAESEATGVVVRRDLTGAMQAGSDIDDRVEVESLRVVRRNRCTPRGILARSRGSEIRS